jgi:tetratricopeptide (TPR) repeat protein
MTANTLKLFLLAILLSGCAGNQQKTLETEPSVYDQLPLTEQVQLAEQAYYLKRWNESYQLYKNILAKKTESADNWFRLGVSAYRLNKKQEAERYFEQVVKKENRHSRALYNLSVISLGKGRRYLEQYLQVIPPKQRDLKLTKTLEILDRYEF